MANGKPPLTKRAIGESILARWLGKPLADATSDDFVAAGIFGPPTATPAPEELACSLDVSEITVICRMVTPEAMIEDARRAALEEHGLDAASWDQIRAAKDRRLVRIDLRIGKPMGSLTHDDLVDLADPDDFRCLLGWLADGGHHQSRR
jgi:hypothetical protein